MPLMEVGQLKAVQDPQGKEPSGFIVLTHLRTKTHQPRQPWRVFYYSNYQSPSWGIEATK
jgi:hypothetical protein